MLKAKIERKFCPKKLKNRDFSNWAVWISTKFGGRLRDIPADDCANLKKNPFAEQRQAIGKEIFFVGG